MDVIPESRTTTGIPGSIQPRTKVASDSLEG